MKKYALGLVLSLFFCGISCASMIPAHSDEYSQYMEEFAPLFKNTYQIVTNHKNPGLAEESLRVIPIPERGAIVKSIGDNPNICIETTGIKMCVGIAAWNSQKIGLVHWSFEKDKLLSLRPFLKELTEEGSLNKETAFVLCTQYLSTKLKDVYKFLAEHAGGATFFLEAKNSEGEYTILKNFRRYYPKKSGGRLLLASNADESKSLSIKSTFSPDTPPYSFTTGNPTSQIQDYFLHFTVRQPEGYLSPEAYWKTHYPSQTSTEPKAFWKVAQTVYEQAMSGASREELVHFVAE